jgi:ketosteroid isomerase-like protein
VLRGAAALAIPREDEILRAMSQAKPQEHVERVRSISEAFNRGDVEAVVRAVHPDIEFTRVGDQSPVRGVAGLREWMEPDAFQDQRFEPLDFKVNGNKVLVEQRFTGRGAASGMELDFTTFAVFTLDDDGLVTRLEAFLPHEEAQALEAAGLTE